MNYLDSAFHQLAFAIKLMHAAEQGKLQITEIDIPLTISNGKSIFVLDDNVLSGPLDLILACQNNVTIAFGAAAITLNRCREECDINLPNPIEDEFEQWIALVYQIRCAFAHDIAEPRWSIKERYARRYMIRNVHADLTKLDEQHFEYEHIGGPDALFSLKQYAKDAFFP